MNGVKFHWMNNDNIAEDAETGEEKNAAIQVEMKNNADQLACEVPKTPVLLINIIVNQEWEATEMHEVCDGQIQQDDDACSPWPHLQNIH